MDPPPSFKRNAALVISFPTEEDQDEDKEEGNIRVSSSSSSSAIHVIRVACSMTSSRRDAPHAVTNTTMSTHNTIGGHHHHHRVFQKCFPKIGYMYE